MTDETNPFHSMIAITRDENSPLSFGRSGDNPPYVYAFQLKCKNTSASPIEPSGMMVTSETVNYAEAIMMVDGKLIAPGAEFTLVKALAPIEGSGMENGLFFEDFRKRYGAFLVKIDLADGSYGTWSFPAEEVEAMLAAGEKAVARP